MIAQQEGAVQTSVHNDTTQMYHSFQVELVLQVNRPFREKQALMRVSTLSNMADFRKVFHDEKTWVIRLRKESR
jgi:hypothetical protein